MLTNIMIPKGVLDMKNSKLHTPLVRFLTTAIGLVCAGSNLHAQEVGNKEIGLEEVIVTAQRRDQSLQDVAAAVSALSGKTIEDIGAEELADYFGFVPSVNAAHNSYGERGGQNIVIRGIANARLGGTDASSLSSTTGFYLNNVPVTPVDTQLFDISRIEVLRGPQGTLYGGGSMGGAIKLFHNRPDASEFYGVVEGTVDSVEDGGLGNGLNVMLNIPIFEDVLAARLVATSRSSGGYIDAIMPSLSTTTPNSSVLAPVLGLDRSDSSTYKKDTNTTQSKGLRAAVLYTPDDRLSIDASVLWQKANIDGMHQYNTLYSQDRLTETYMLEPKESEMSLTTLNISYDFGLVSLHSDTGFYKRTYDETIDFTQSMYSLGGAKDAGLDFIPAYGPLEGFIEWETLTQEVRLQSNYAESDNALLSRLDWVLGAFKMDEQRNGSQLLHAPGWGAATPSIPLPIANDIYLANKTDIQDESSAVFADLTFKITDRLTVSAGLRSYDQSTDQSRPKLNPANTVIPQENVTAQSEGGTIPRFNVSYDLSDDISIYGSMSEGFRLGGATQPIDYSATPECESVVNDNNLQQFAAGEYGSDAVETSEIGMKSSFADGRSTLNISAYQTDWTNLQQQVTLSNFPNSECTRVLTANVGAATVDGFEVEFESMLSDRLRVQASVSFTDSKISDPGKGVTVTSPGDRIQNVPDWSGSVIARYNVPTEMLGGGNFFVQGDLRYMGERTSVIGEPSDPLLLLEAYTLLGVRTGVTLSDESLSIALFIKNVTDEIVQSNASGRFGVSGNVLHNTQAPRTIGVTVSKSF